MRWISLPPAEAYESHRLWGDDKYQLQNMLLKQVSMPARIAEGEDQFFDVYQDRCYDAWREAVEVTRHKFPNEYGGGDSYFHHMPDVAFLFFARQVAQGVGETWVPTGARLVRFTNRSSGYPCLRLDAIHMVHRPAQRRVYTGMDGPAVVQPRDIEELYPGADAWVNIRHRRSA